MKSFRNNPELNFNPRSPCGERHCIHFQGRPLLKFQPTLPVRGATHHSVNGVEVVLISTHAPRAGSDKTALHRGCYLSNFNPRSPCGERLDSDIGINNANVFQPTLPVRGATNVLVFPLYVVRISTHAPRAGSDDIYVCGCPSFMISTHAPRAGSDRAACDNIRRF